MMKETETILRLHAKHFHVMMPTDAVKLLYQNEFGGGHLITDPPKALRYLTEEYEKTPRDNSQPLIFPIGNGIVRINLAALDTKVLSLERLNEIFVESSHSVHGNLESFLEKLQSLRLLTAEGVFSFTPQELDAYLCDYAERNYPAVSHSEIYREAYQPAYRVVLEEKLKNNGYPNDISRDAYLRLCSNIFCDIISK